MSIIILKMDGGMQITINYDDDGIWLEGKYYDIPASAYYKETYE